MSGVGLDFGGRRIEMQPGESVLEALERAGERIESSCRSGVCQSCLVKGVPGQVPASAQAGLSAGLKREGYFLACLHRPQADLRAEAAGAGASFRAQARIERVDRLAADVVGVTLSRPEGLDFRAGQFLGFRRDDGLLRSYSVASQPSETELRIHVRLVLQGRMSRWFHEEARRGDLLELSGPRGECCYEPELPRGETLTLVGTGTGMAPLLALAREALRHGHAGEIHVFDGALRPERLYLRGDFEALAREHASLRYHPCALMASDAGDAALLVGDLAQIVLARMPALKAGRFYLCGDSALVQPLRKKLFLSGAALARIHADPFVPAVAKPAPTGGAEAAFASPPPA